MAVINKAIFQLTVPTPFAVGDAHIYVLKGDVLSLVDAGVRTEKAWEALVTQLKDLGYTPNDIEQIILTHHHPDHTGLVDRFERVKDIVAHANVEPWLTRDEAYFDHFEEFYYEYFDQNGVPEHFRSYLQKLRAQLDWAGVGQLTKKINEGDKLPGHSEFTVVETKGHAQSHLSFLSEDGTFIGGDHLLEHMTPNPIMEPPKIGKKNRPTPLLQYRANLQKCLELDIKKVLPGHGKVFSNVEEVVARGFAKQENRANKVLNLLKAYPQTPYQICEQIFPMHYKTQIDLTMSETIGQLDYLEDKGLVVKTVEDGVLYYHAV
ncbi:MBL fold metallo-hydrolase [Ornithinibacillus halotolerans]|uniref:Hydrolase n=1 Tax=Ornithinibacillus halotolerans TaxID=1274357 RepID=A0A916RRI3_9BACI|nr:MBL fold metallo-hydrolase [Ornithinibacillus halotolerans]GGA67681.1 hydrolase [Ornithinibacillus halotolerans]